MIKKKIIKKNKPKTVKPIVTDVVCIGGVNQDIFFYSDQLYEIPNPKKDPNCLMLLGAELSAKIVGKKMVRTNGGGAGNAAVNFSNLGLKTAIVSAVGSDVFGTTAIDYFKERKIDCQFIKKINNKETALSFLLSNSQTGNHTVFLFDGAKSELTLNVADLKKLNPGWIYVTSLSSNWEVILKQVKSYVASNDCKLVWNPGAIQLAAGADVLKPYISLCEMLIVNRDEAKDLVASGKELSANETLEKLGELGARVNVMTDGPAGVYVTVGKQRFYEPALSNLKPVNTTGAGDAFGSTFVAGIHQGFSLQLAMRYAIRQSSNILKIIGSQAGLKGWSSLKKNN